MSKLLKKLLSSFLIAVFLLISVAIPSAKAQTVEPWYNQKFTQWSNKVFLGDQNEIFGERYTFAQVTWIIHSLTAIVAGPEVAKCAAQGGDPIALATCVKELPKLASSGLVPSLAYIDGTLLSTRLASGTQYLASTVSKFHIIPETYAQGVGFASLQPLQVAWGAVRNISYFLLIIAFIVMAFMIMFRVKISPQLVVTIQSALPRLVFTLILITFSYAIAGLLIDLSYLVVGVLALAIKTVGGTVSSLNTIDLFVALISLKGLAALILGIMIYALVFIVFGAIAGAIGGVGGMLGATIVMLILLIFIVWILIRILWLLLKTITNSILLIIGGPILILLGVFPNAGGFGGWIKNLLANLAVYPTMLTLIFLSHYFWWAWAGGISGADILNPFGIKVIDTTGTINLPGAGLSTKLLGFIVAFVILFLVPKAADLIQSLIAGKPFALGAAIGEATNPFGLRVMGQGIAGGFISNQLYNPKTNTGLLVDLINRARSGGGGTTRGPGAAGGGPTV